MKALIFFILITPTLLNSQSITLNDNFSMDVEKVKFKKTTRGGDGWVVNSDGEKFLILNCTFYSKAKKRTKLELFRMKIQTNNDEYLANSEAGFTPFDDNARYFKMKNKRKTNIYFDVKEDFKEGKLYYDGNLIGIIRILPDSKDGTFEIIN